VTIVAAENFYGDVAQQIGGADVKVTSILSNPDEDPHPFEASPSVGRAISGARIVVYSGIDYDPWMEKLLAAAQSADRQVIVVADLGGHKSGDNPHIWYDVDTMLAFARTLADKLGGIDPVHKAAYVKRLEVFQRSMRPNAAEIAALHERLAGTPVTATEPVFGHMLNALGMSVRNQSFQLSVMNNTEPRPSDVAAFENDLKGHRVKLLIYNGQPSDPVAERILRRSRGIGHPGWSGSPRQKYQAWMIRELDAVDQALR
jgi:zinc/manganese transport system substrate-binding protein